MRPSVSVTAAAPASRAPPGSPAPARQLLAPGSRTSTVDSRPAAPSPPTTTSSPPLLSAIAWSARAVARTGPASQSPTACALADAAGAHSAPSISHTRRLGRATPALSPHPPRTTLDSTTMTGATLPRRRVAPLANSSESHSVRSGFACRASEAEAASRVQASAQRPAFDRAGPHARARADARRSRSARHPNDRPRTEMGGRDRASAVDGWASAIDGCASAIDGCASAIDGCGSAIDGCGSAIDGCGSAIDGCASAIDGCGARVSAAGRTPSRRRRGAWRSGPRR
jgi:hypothetical protein